MDSRFGNLSKWGGRLLNELASQSSAYFLASLPNLEPQTHSFFEVLDKMQQAEVTCSFHPN
ncbi:MAG: hypothetical protein JRM85_08420 [Nitrososphaerota archaeon]|nr:hypothetical protein [Nitrososphaerota archaeon]